MLNRIFTRMKELNLSQSDIAASLNIKQATVSAWKTRNSDLPASYVLKLSELLSVSPLWLLMGNIDTAYITADEKSILESYRNCSLDAKKQIVDFSKERAILYPLKGEKSSKSVI